GSEVTLKGPVGFAVSFIYGQTLVAELPTMSKAERLISMTGNFVLEGSSDLNTDRAMFIHKLGHYGIMVLQAKFAEVVDFYQDLINLVDWTLISIWRPGRIN